jgi:hypothetical protein
MFRLANVSVAATAVLIVIYTIIFSADEGAMSVGGVLAIIFAIRLFSFLDKRDYRVRHSGKSEGS